jgi:erythromycin esterase-like protein
VNLRLRVMGIGAAMLAATACSSPTADVAATELRAVVESDAIVMDANAVPDVVVDRLAENKVVLLGETHHLREHWEFVATLMSELYGHGFRQLLIEAPHMAGWLLDDYVQGSPLMPDWTVTPFYDRRLSLIRDFNQTVAADPIHVRSIDANEVGYGGAHDFHLLLTWFADTLPTAGPLGPFLDMPYGDADPSQQQQAIESLLEALDADRDELIDSWDTDRYEQLVELLTMELASIEVRAARENNDDEGARARENLIKRLVAERVDGCRCGTVINIGGHHAQKSHLMGTEQEWLGDHLVNTGEAVDGSVIVIGFASATTELEPGAGGTPWDVIDSNSPDNEVFRIMAETLPGRTVFLPLDDPLFAERTVAYNSEDVIYITAPKEQFDVLIQYGVAHRMPVN